MAKLEEKKKKRGPVAQEDMQMQVPMARIV
jgi:hypothetical protein